MYPVVTEEFILEFAKTVIGHHTPFITWPVPSSNSIGESLSKLESKTVPSVSVPCKDKWQVVTILRLYKLQLNYIAISNKFNKFIMRILIYMYIRMYKYRNYINKCFSWYSRTINTFLYIHWRNLTLTVYNQCHGLLPLFITHNVFLTRRLLVFLRLSSIDGGAIKWSVFHRGRVLRWSIKGLEIEESFFLY